MWHHVCEEAELKSGKIVPKEIGGRKVLLTKSADKIYGCGAICPHQGVSMENGWVFDDEITCPEHSWVFSLNDGALTWPGSGPRIPIYPVRILAGIVEVEVLNSGDVND
ncbi:MAG: Rieske 2Fe-2S domain-containing protein [bacterium]